MDTDIGKPLRFTPHALALLDTGASRDFPVHGGKITTDINTCAGLMSDAELIGIAATVMDELKRRSEKRNASAGTVMISQDTRAGAIVRFEDGTPVDRPAWFYLPFLPGLSKYFQPARRGSASVYHEELPEGQVLVVTKGPDVVARVRVGGEQRKIEAGGATIEGRLTLIPDRPPAACDPARHDVRHKNVTERKEVRYR
jgi:hypothetical protein